MFEYPRPTAASTEHAAAAVGLALQGLGIISSFEINPLKNEAQTGCIPPLMGAENGGDDSGSEEVAAWQITAVCLQICPTEASIIKRDAATERFTVVDIVCSCWSLLHQHADDFGPFLAFRRPMTVYSPHLQHHAKMLNGGSIISE